MFNCIASGQFNPNDPESLLPSLCSTPSLFTFQTAEEPLNNFQANDEPSNNCHATEGPLDDVNVNDIRSEEQLSYELKEEVTVNDYENDVIKIEEISNDRESYSSDENIQKCDDSLEPKNKDQSETLNIGYETDSENFTNLTVSKPNSILDSGNYQSPKTTEPVPPILTNCSIPTSPAVNYGSIDFKTNLEYGPSLQGHGISKSVNPLSDAMQHIHINHYTANLTYLPHSGGITAMNIPPPALPTQIQVTSPGGLAIRQPVPFASYPLNYVAPFPQPEAVTQPIKHSTEHSFPPPLLIYPTSNSTGPSLHLSMYPSSNDQYNPCTTTAVSDDDEKIMKYEPSQTQVASVINSSQNKSQDYESRKTNQDETQIKPKLAVNEDQELAGLYETRNRNTPEYSTVPTAKPVIAKVSSPHQFVGDERRVCHRPTPPPFPLIDHTNNSSPTSEGKSLRQAEINHNNKVDNIADDHKTKQTANVKSWASLLFASTEQSVERVSVEKPTARIPPFSTTPPEPEAGSNGTDNLLQHRLKIGKYLKNYELNHTSAALMPRGLTNKSNWCFVNAILQALLACPTFYNLLKNLPYEMEGNIDYNISISTTPMLDTMVGLVKEFRPLKIFGRHPLQKKDRLSSRQDIQSDCAIEPTKVYNVLLKSSQWREESDNVGGVGEERQQDAEEFLSHLLNILDEEMRSLIMLVNSTQIHERQVSWDLSRTGRTSTFSK